MPVPRGQPQTHEVVAVAATEELTPAARLAERKKMMQERVQKAKTSKYSTVAESPGANPSEPAATAPESSNDTPEQDRIATPESSESAAPADATPKAPERGKYEEASPAEVAAEIFEVSVSFSHTAVLLPGLPCGKSFRSGFERPT